MISIKILNRSGTRPALYASRDLHGVGRGADIVPANLHGGRTYLNPNPPKKKKNDCAV